MNLSKFSQARLVERVDFTDHLAAFRFRPDRPLAFAAGQYATLALLDGEKLIQRAYSIVSSPHEGDLEFFIELVPEGELTPRLWEIPVGGDLLIRAKIVGRFTQDADLKRHLMLATVTGVAPYLSMVRHHAHRLAAGEALPDRFLIVHGASHSRDFGTYHDELVNLARADWLHYVPTVSRPWEDEDWTGETGRVGDVVRKHADAFDFGAGKAVAYACGHPQMIENTHGLLTRARFPAEHFREEKYFTA